MKTIPEDDPLAERPDLDFSKGVRGRYAGRTEGSNLILLAPDLLESFPNSEAVNKALRSLKEIPDRVPKAS